MTAALLGALAVVASTYIAAFAQAGSTGGTVGNTDKAISGGGEEQPAQRHRTIAPRPRAAAPSAQREQETKHASCRDIVGRWSWVVGTETVFNGDGTAQNNAGFTAKWICADGVVVVTWNHGVTNKVEISRDRNSLTIDGGSFSSARK